MGTHAKILLVEDDALLGPLTTEVLEDCGHEVVLANTWRRGFDLLAAPNAFDLDRRRERVRCASKTCARYVDH